MQTFRPSTLEQLVAIVGDAHDNRLRVRAVGSSWSYTDVAVSDNVQVVVETDQLRTVLTGAEGSTDTIVPGALNAAAAGDAGHLVHVEAGIKIEELNCRLDRMDRAMPTLGGERGQSLLGAISTATHGAHVALPPIADAVQAIHLVGPGGREWWIERAGARSITDPARMENLRRSGRLCSDLILEYDDTTFNAVLVSMGRLGIVYSVVVRVRDAFRLRETRDRMQWSAIQGTLRGPGPEAPVRAFNADFVEIVFNPYRNARGDNDCVVTQRSETTEQTRRPRATTRRSRCCAGPATWRGRFVRCWRRSTRRQRRPSASCCWCRSSGPSCSPPPRRRS